MFEFASNQQLALALFVSFANAILLCFCSYKLLHIFQLCGYKVRNFVAWLFDKRSKFYIRLFALSVLSVGSLAVVNVLFYKIRIIYYSYLGLVFYFYLSIVFVMNVQRARAKVSLKFTPRMQRLVVSMFTVFFFVTQLFIWLGTDNPYVRFALIGFMPMALPFVLIVCNCIVYPIELWIRFVFTYRAKKKLKQPQFANLIRIGITGSWGKTSCKNILKTILSENYCVCASPASFNTPMGFAKTVNNILIDDCDVLIFEMGARYVNDIKYLSRLFKPHHGILTGIGPQHLETFKTIDNIKRAKGDLLRALPVGGFAIVNGRSELCREVYDELCSETKFLSIVEEVAKDISVTADGCKFTLCLDGQEEVECVTKLLGEHNIENIVMCALLASKIGMKADEIARAVAKLEPVAHRLELVRSANGILILDDSYNASPNGTKAALNVLGLFSGLKVVLTPGMVELGSKAVEENFKFGVRLGKVADKVIIVGEVNRAAISDGLLSSGFDSCNIFTVATLEEAKGVYTKLLSAGDVLLIENDLPDNFV